VQEQTLFIGRWETGQRASFRFEVTTPPGPFSYQGRLFNVEWYVHASVDLPSMRDAHVEQKVQIVPTGPVAQADFGSKPAFVDDLIGIDPKQITMGFRARYVRGRDGRALSCLALPLILFGLAALVSGAVFSVENLRRGQVTSDTLSIMLATPSLALIILVFARYLLRPILARSRMGQVDVQLSSRMARPGDTVAYTVTCQPRVQLELDRLSVKLVAREESTCGYGSSSSVRSHPVSETEQVESARSIGRGETVAWSGALRVPDEAPPSFFAEHNELLWSLDVVFSIRGWTDWHGRYFILVGPHAAEPPGGTAAEAV
jgi:hypothetical protein